VSGIAVVPPGARNYALAPSGTVPAAAAAGPNDTLWIVLALAALILLVFPWRVEIGEEADIGGWRESVMGGVAK
jgi:hypothetical protein